MGGKSTRLVIDYEFVRYRCECGEITVLQGARGVSRSPFCACKTCGAKALPETEQQKRELEKMMVQYLK